MTERLPWTSYGILQRAYDEYYGGEQLSSVLRLSGILARHERARLSHGYPLWGPSYVLGMPLVLSPQVGEIVHSTAMQTQVHVDDIMQTVWGLPGVYR